VKREVKEHPDAYPNISCRLEYYFHEADIGIPSGRAVKLIGKANRSFVSHEFCCIMPRKIRKEES